VCTVHPAFEFHLACVLKCVVIVFKISRQRKKVVDLMAAKWVAKRCRPFGITETDAEHREWIHAIFGGAYKGPSRETFMSSA
jgi:hypothetical protein